MSLFKNSSYSPPAKALTPPPHPVPSISLFSPPSHFSVEYLGNEQRNSLTLFKVLHYSHILLGILCIETILFEEISVHVKQMLRLKLRVLTKKYLDRAQNSFCNTITGDAPYYVTKSRGS